MRDIRRLAFIVLTSLAACAGARVEQRAIAALGLPGDVSQLVLVEWRAGHEARLTLYQRDADWRPVVGPVPAIVGHNGVVEAAAKREGDGMTPAGIYALGPAFGYAATGATAMRYREATADAVWIDDPDAPDYNTWTTVSATQARSFEHMRRDDALYELGLVVDYNSNPVRAGAGSAIFLHVWTGPTGSTSGCVAVDKTTLALLFAKLAPARKPHIVIQSPTATLR